MARPLKVGADYFPFDVDLDVKIDFIESKYANDGFAVIVKLWQKIYKENGYYCKWDSDIAMLFAFKNANNISVERLNGIIDLAFEKELFSKEVFEKYGVLTSAGVQRRYLLVAVKRSRVDLDERYLLIDVPKNAVNVYINGVKVSENSKKVDNNAQSKVKESKENKSTVNESKINEKDNAPAAQKLARKYGDFTDILSNIENENLIKAYIDFIEMRQKCKKPMTKRAFELLVRKVKEIEPVSVDNQIKMLEESIEHGWQSVYPLKNNKSAQVQKNKFNNYEETNKTDYAALEDKLLDMMLEDSNGN